MKVRITEKKNQVKERNGEKKKYQEKSNSKNRNCKNFEK